MIVTMKGIKLKETKEDTFFIISTEIRVGTFEEAVKMAKDVELHLRNLLEGQKQLGSD